eukprot:2447768-Alexandrium_andersonii.AAC.1
MPRRSPSCPRPTILARRSESPSKPTWSHSSLARSATRRGSLTTPPRSRPRQARWPPLSMSGSNLLAVKA